MFHKCKTAAGRIANGCSIFAKKLEITYSFMQL